VVGGGLGIAPVVALQLGTGHDAHATLAAVTSVAAAAIGLGLAWSLYRQAAADPIPGLMRGAATALANRFYVDELYRRTAIRFHDALAETVDWLDRWFIAGAMVRGLSGTVELTGRVLRLLQTGNLQTHAFLLTLGIALILYFMIGR
jgi:NADH-quinone oxidoreductase subunit L